MKKIVLVNVLINLGLMMVFVLLINNAFNKGLEETLIFLSIIYGVIVIMVNGIFCFTIRR